MSGRTSRALAAIGALLAIGAVLVDHVGSGSSDFGREQGVGFVLGIGLILAALPWARLPRSSFGDEGTPGAGLPRRVAIGLGAALLGLAVFVYLFKLGTPTWHPDELDYSRISLDYVEHGRFEENLEHPFLAKYLIGISEVVFGEGEWGTRLPAALAGLATGVALFLFGRRVAGIGAGLLAFALWALLPHPSMPEGGVLAAIKVERFGLLDVFMVAFFTAAMYAGWRWARAGSSRWAVAAGVLTGLAAASKAPGALALVPLVGHGFAVLGRTSRTTAQALALVATSALVFLLTYLPLGGDAPSTLGDMFEFQRDHAEVGHPLLIDGRTYNHPPSWANLWLAWRSVGALPAVSLTLLVLASPFLVARRLAGYLLLALGTLLGFYCLAVPLALPHYYVAFMAPAALLAALSLSSLLARGGGARIAAVVLVVPLAWAAVETVIDVARVRSANYAAAAERLEREGLGRATVGTIGYPGLLRAYAPSTRIGAPGAQVTIVDPIVARRDDPKRLRFKPEPLRAFRLWRADRLSVYVRRAPAAGAPRPAPQR